MNIKDLVNKHDPQNQFEVLVNTYQQIEFAWENKFNVSSAVNKKFNNIVIAGLGGSAISADLISNFLHEDLRLPLSVVRSYNLPKFADENTLLICSTYSGNTEETNSVLVEGYKKKCTVICITTGGKAGKFAAEKSIPVVHVKEGYQPRYALGVSFFTVLKVLQQLNLIDHQTGYVEKILQLWKEKGEEFSKENNPAINYAEQLIGFVPVIYSAAELTNAVGYRFKSQLNENSKLHAFAGVIPEMNHNEIIGWETFNASLLNAKLINIIDRDYHPQILKRFEITSQLVKKAGADVINLESSLEDFKVRIMDLTYLCDWISYYLAILRGKDPSEIDYIHYLKDKLA
jgi:glucose/mannose-6-phosphate isomerase